MKFTNISIKCVCLAVVCLWLEKNLRGSTSEHASTCTSRHGWLLVEQWNACACMYVAAKRQFIIVRLLCEPMFTTDADNRLAIRCGVHSSRAKPGLRTFIGVRQSPTYVLCPARLCCVFVRSPLPPSVFVVFYRLMIPVYVVALR